MIIDFTNSQPFDGVIVFPEFAFGVPPAQGGGSPGVGGPVLERRIIGGTTSDVTSEAGGMVDDED